MVLKRFWVEILGSQLQCVARAFISNRSEYHLGELELMQGAYYFILTDERGHMNRGKFVY